MQYDDVTGFSLSFAAFAGAGWKGWRKRDPTIALGQSCFFETRYLAHELRYPSPRDWLKSQKSVWPRVLEEWGVGRAAIVHPPPSSQWRGGYIREVLIASSLVPPILLDIVMRTGPASASRRTDAEDLFGRWVACGISGLSLRGEEVSIACSAGRHACKCRVSPAGDVQNVNHLLALRPHWLQAWDTLKQGWSGHLLLPDSIGQASVKDLLKFLFLHCRKLGSQNVDQFEKCLLREVNSVIARGLELHVVKGCLATAQRPLKKLHGKERRCRIDPDELASLKRRVNTVAGSSRVAIVAITGDPSCDYRLFHVHNHLYLDKIKESFAGTKLVSLAWDAATYGGESTNCGVVLAGDRELVATLPIKVHEILNK